jgi:hypothetical protein
MKIRLIDQKIIDELTRPTRTSLWGYWSDIQPAWVPETLGDGMRVMAVSPLATRPNYYVIRCDSSWVDDVWRDRLDEVYEAIEDSYGAMCGDSYEFCKEWGDGESCGRHHEDDAWFPFLFDGGSEWWTLANLNSDRVRQLIKIRDENECARRHPLGRYYEGFGWCQRDPRRATEQPERTKI